MTLPPPLRFDVEDAPGDADIEVLTNGLEAFNESRWPGHQPWRPLAVFAREGKSVVAGLAGEHGKRLPRLVARPPSFVEFFQPVRQDLDVGVARRVLNVEAKLRG